MVVSVKEISGDGRWRGQAFVVCLHDVTPRHEREILEQLDALRPLVGNAVSAAVIPAAPGLEWSRAGQELRDALRLLERILHGYRHRRPRCASPISIASGHCDEFAALHPRDIHRCLDLGQRVLAEAFGCAADGFLAPAWRSGALRLEHLVRANLSFYVGLAAVRAISGRAVPLATYSWDWGPIGGLGRLGAVAGRFAELRALAPVRVVALHPRDRARGFLGPALDLIRRWLDQGLAPVRFRDALEDSM